MGRFRETEMKITKEVFGVSLELEDCKVEDVPSGRYFLSNSVLFLMPHGTLMDTLFVDNDRSKSYTVIYCLNVFTNELLPVDHRRRVDLISEDEWERNIPTTIEYEGDNNGKRFVLKAIQCATREVP